MTMTTAERERLIKLSEDQAGLLKEGEIMKQSINRIHTRIDEMHDHLKGMTESLHDIVRQNDGHEERLAMLQEATSSLCQSVSEVDKACKRLKHLSFGFLALLIIMTVFVGILGEEILPKAFKWLWALVGL